MASTLELFPFFVSLGVGLLVAVLEVLVPPMLLDVLVEATPELVVPALSPVPKLPFVSPTLLLLPLSVAVFPSPDPGP